ncbi:MAG: RNA-binding S4 domain-containing protein [Rhodobacteraceae bacterium]|nr:RNA-binding S4 domain-containing protein [Paracoccaceae bacterium]
MAARPSAPAPDPAAQRLDKWLWQARFFRSRGAAAAAVAAGGVRLNGVRTDKPARAVAPGDTLTLVHGGRVRLVRVLALGRRRGPAAEAATLWRDLAAPDGSQGPVLE